MAYLNQPIDFGASADFGPQVQMPKPKAGMFGAGKPDWASAISAALSGYLAARGNPVGTMGLQMLHQRRQAQDEEAQYQRQRGEKLEDYAKMQQIQAQYGAPPSPHYFEDNSGNQMAIGPDGKPQMVYQDPNPFKLVPNGMGGVVPVNMQALIAGMGQGAQPVGKITPIDGGPMPQASGGFRY